MIRNAFSPYGDIESVYLVHKDGKPACYGFVNFRTHESAALALTAAKTEEIVLVDKRDAIWHVKAEWTATTDIPRKTKKKKLPKCGAKSPDTSGVATPPMDLWTSLNGYHPASRVSQFKSTQSLSYTVQKPFTYTVPAFP
jgi:RNA recognition motif-containing protein